MSAIGTGSPPQTYTMDLTFTGTLGSEAAREVVLMATNGRFQKATNARQLATLFAIAVRVSSQLSNSLSSP